MPQESERSFINPLYSAWRTAVFKRDNGKCRICGAEGKEVHHIVGWTKDPKLRFEINNGITLCLDCHTNTENFYRPTEEDYSDDICFVNEAGEEVHVNLDDDIEYLDEDGDVINLDDPNNVLVVDDEGDVIYVGDRLEYQNRRPVFNKSADWSTFWKILVGVLIFLAFVFSSALCGSNRDEYGMPLDDYRGGVR